MGIVHHLLRQGAIFAPPIDQNNDEPNYGGSMWGDPYAMARLDGNTNVTMQPTDAGGWRMSSSDQTFGGPGAWWGGSPNNINGPVYFDGEPCDRRPPC